MADYHRKEGGNGNRKRRRSDNPLSDARGKKKAESLWHRKSGAGYSLFVQFYARQPEAVCRYSSTSEGNKTPDKAQSPRKNPNQTGAGLSRAARRRKRKKGKTVSDEKEDNPPTSSLPGSSESPLPLADSRLLVALGKITDPTICQNESYRSFLVALSNPLPLTFRLRRGIGPSTELDIRRKLDRFDSLVKRLPFDDSIYQAKSSTLSKNSLNKVSPELKEFLVSETQHGTLARQELGSMLPVLALSKGGWLGQGCRVLDLCASPGSKTLQALEIVGASGRVRANDIKESRLSALKEAVERSRVPQAERIKYTMHDASKYPVPDRLFDAIICDVPCSGDGTIRKDPHILPEWTPNTSNALHGLQLSILKRAIECVKVGGVVSYSTCSLNPVEDEAVVCSVLVNEGNPTSGPAVQLEDWPTMEGFLAEPGVRRWCVADYDGTCESDDDDEPRLRWHESYEEAQASGMASRCLSMWPPESGTPSDLEKCVRLHPQDHNTGGFFVALLRRVR